MVVVTKDVKSQQATNKMREELERVNSDLATAMKGLQEVSTECSLVFAESFSDASRPGVHPCGLSVRLCLSHEAAASYAQAVMRWDLVLSDCAHANDA